MADVVDAELLFFDTFSHDNTEDSNLDLVQFTRPVLIKEVRIIPLGTRVEADVPGGHRLGATNPSSFKLELYVNNLAKPNAATFERLGVMEYDKNDIQLVPPMKVPTDGLILKGWYTTITLAVYGNGTKVPQERSSPPPPPPPQPRAKTQTTQQPHGQQENAPPPPPPAAVPSSGLGAPDWAPDKHIFTQPPPAHVPVMGGQALLPTPPSHPIDLSVPPPTTIQPHSHPPSTMEHERHEHKDSSKFRDSYSDDRRENRHEQALYDRTREPNLSSERDSRTPQPHDSNRNKSTDSHDKDYPTKERSHNRRYSNEHESTREPESKNDNYSEKDYSEHYLEGSHDSDRETSAPRSPSVKATSPGPLPERVRIEEAEPGACFIQGEIEEEENIDSVYGGMNQVAMIENMLSDGEIERGEDVEYEPISSDEDLAVYYRVPDISGIVAEQTSTTDEDIAIDVISGFNPEQFYLVNPQNFSDPSLTQYEIMKISVIKKDKDEVIPPDAQQLIDVVETYKNVDHHGKWIEALEDIPKYFVTGLSYLLNKEDRKDVLDTLIDWALEGLDLEKAIQQPETAYKVRHLKMGIKLTGALCTCDTFIAFRMLAEEVQNKLLDLFTSQYMSASIKLQIVRALDCTVYFHEGMDWFLGQHPIQIKTSTGTSANTPYKRLVKVLTEKQAVRTVFALSALVRKIHFYELLHKINHIVQSIQEKYEKWLSENGPPPVDKEKSVDEIDVAMDTDEGPPVIEGIGEEEIDGLIECLEEINKVMMFAPDLIAQPKKKKVPTATLR